MQGVLYHKSFVLKFPSYSVWEALLKAAAIASFQGKLHVPACFQKQDFTPT